MFCFCDTAQTEAEPKRCVWREVKEEVVADADFGADSFNKKATFPPSGPVSFS